MQVVGIDVGPAKGGHVCKDGANVRVRLPQSLERDVNNLGSDVLVAWDAPLTGCSDPDGALVESDLTRRVIEAFFSQGDFKPPEGVSVLGYSSCPHWTITRRVLGLPRVGRYDCLGIPFSLATHHTPPKSGRHVVEVHPALWLWIKSEDDLIMKSWRYKDDTCVRQRIWDFLKERYSEKVKRLDLEGRSVPKDDELDSITAWLLARGWLDGDDVMLLGDARTGAMLLPSVEGLRDRFENYRKQERTRRAKSAVQ
ncbi:MAG: DUF429 domain-containing protein [Bryobacteraceae bacterium]